MRRFAGYRPPPRKQTVGLSIATALAPSSSVRQHPDAALMAACDAFLTAQDQIEALFNGSGRIEDDRQRTAAVEALEDARWPLLQEMEGLRACTFEGVLARLHVLRLDPAELETPDGAGEDHNGRLLRLMLRDLFAIYGRPSA